MGLFSFSSVTGTWIVFVYSGSITAVRKLLCLNWSVLLVLEEVMSVFHKIHAYAGGFQGSFQTGKTNSTSLTKLELSSCF